MLDLHDFCKSNGWHRWRQPDLAAPDGQV